MVSFWILLDISCFKVRNNYKAHWQRHLKGILQLKILRTWINIRVTCFLGKYYETKLGECALEIISCTKIRACSLKNVALIYFTYYCILLFLWNKASFSIQPSVDRIIFTTIYLPFWVLIPCVSWSSSSGSKHLMRLNAWFWRFTTTKCSYYVFIFHEIFVPVNVKN